MKLTLYFALLLSLFLPLYANAMGQKEYELRRAMDSLWVDHGAWTRSFIIEAVNNNASGKEAAANRLMKNQEDIGNVVASFYGSEAGNTLTSLLKDHIKISADVVAAAKANNQSQLQAANNRWHANADDIARFLTNANPKNWPFKIVQNMLYDHLKLTTDEAVARIKKDWDADVTAFDNVLKQLQVMSKALADGIVHQFPVKFK
jgi:hypothetical protein